MNIYLSKSNRTGVYSFYDSSTDNPPVEGSANWNAYTHTQVDGDYETKNVFAYLILNSTTSAQIDDGITSISQYNVTYETSNLRTTNITLASNNSFNITIRSNTVDLSSSFLNFTYKDGSRIYPLNTSTCTTDNPSWNTTTIDGEVHKACYKDNGDGTISARFATPHLSEQTYQVNYESTQPTISNFRFYALNSSQKVIGNETAFNNSNLQTIEFMMINFTVDDLQGNLHNVSFYYTANGTNGCSLGNTQSSSCYNYDNNKWIHFKNGTDTSTFYDFGTIGRGDSITCSYVSNSGDTQRNYTCIIDEHYNPNVWEHYPMNTSDLKMQDGVTERIKKNTIMKVDLDIGIILQNADLYKLDCMFNYTTGALEPTSPITGYGCDSVYNDTLGDPSTSENCKLISSLLPSQFQDDGTKARGIFSSNFTSTLGNLSYLLITSNTPTSKYYYAKTYKYLGSGGVRTSFSNDNGDSYTYLSDGYESECNINPFYNGTNNNITGIVIKVNAEDLDGNNINSSTYTLNWNLASLNRNPIVVLNSPNTDDVLNQTTTINFTVLDLDADTLITNITLYNGTTINIFENISQNNNSIFWNLSSYGDGYYNLTVYACENETTEKYCASDFSEIQIDNDPEPPTTTTTTSSSSDDSSETIILQGNDDANPDSGSDFIIATYKSIWYTGLDSKIDIDVYLNNNLFDPATLDFEFDENNFYYKSIKNPDIGQYVAVFETDSNLTEGQYSLLIKTTNPTLTKEITFSVIKSNTLQQISKKLSDNLKDITYKLTGKTDEKLTKWQVIAIIISIVFISFLVISITLLTIKSTKKENKPKRPTFNDDIF